MFEGIAEGLQLEELGNRVSGMFFHVISVLCHLHCKGSLRGDSEGEIAEAEVLQIEDLLLRPCSPCCCPSAGGGPAG